MFTFLYEAAQGSPIDSSGSEEEAGEELMPLKSLQIELRGRGYCFRKTVISFE